MSKCQAKKFFAGGPCKISGETSQANNGTLGKELSALMTARSMQDSCFFPTQKTPQQNTSTTLVKVESSVKKDRSTDISLILEGDL